MACLDVANWRISQGGVAILLPEGSFEVNGLQVGTALTTLLDADQS